MSIISLAFAPYIDGNGLLSNSPISHGVIRASDNGPLFSSEYIILLNRNGQASSADGAMYELAIKNCTDANGNLHRAPGDTSEDAPDDYYGAAAGFVEIGVKSNLSLPFNLWRQPQLLFAVMASNQQLSRWKFWQWPLAIYTALVVLTSDINTDTGNADARILAWLLIQATSNSSILVRLASHVWFNRLFATYPNGMNDVAGIYFQPTNNNPYQKYWVTR